MQKIVEIGNRDSKGKEKDQRVAERKGKARKRTRVAQKGEIK